MYERYVFKMEACVVVPQSFFIVNDYFNRNSKRRCILLLLKPLKIVMIFINYHWQFALFALDLSRDSLEIQCSLI